MNYPIGVTNTKTGLIAAAAVPRSNGGRLQRGKWSRWSREPLSRIENDAQGNSISGIEYKPKAGGNQGWSFARNESLADAAVSVVLSTSAPVAQLDRASDFESAGRPFESGRVRH
jgi:hypothetical protein